MDRAEVIAAIEKLAHEPGAEYDGLIEALELRRQHELMSWQRSWIRKSLIAGCVLLFSVIAFTANPRRVPQMPVPGWTLYILFFGGLILILWVYSVLQPRSRVDRFGMSPNCVQCKYDLSGHKSALGDELWVGPKTCPECGQQYPAVGA